MPRARGLLVLLASVLLSVTLGGLLWLAATPTLAVSAALAYAAGLSMIILPCTLPLVFIVVPLSLQGSPGRGLLTALLFGLGLTITISLYAALVAGVGVAASPSWPPRGTARRTEASRPSSPLARGRGVTGA
ncbi:MAG: hypothetical protein V3U31_03650, partial [Dehalococcoidia bacterium]